MVYVPPENQDIGDMETGSRICRECQSRKSMTAFHRANGGRHRRRICKTCCEVRRQERRAADPAAAAESDRHRAWRLKYGLSADQVAARLEEQRHQCGICSSPIRLAVGREMNQRDAAHIDHDHRTGQFRGLLCFNCNVAIGHLRDDPELVDRAATYLRFHAITILENA